MTQPVLVSPCTGVCRMDPDTGWCLGCARTTEEIADWSKAPPEWRSEIRSAIPARLSRLGIGCRRLPWSTEEIRSFLQTSLEQGTGTWVMGVVGAVAEFTLAPGMRAESRTIGTTVTVQTRNGAIALMIDDSVRALCFEPLETPPDRQRIVLAVKREVRRLPVAEAITRLGSDVSRLIHDDAGTLFDLCLGRKEARLCLRYPSGDAHDALCAASGTAFEDCIADMRSRFAMLHHNLSKRTFIFRAASPVGAQAYLRDSLVPKLSLTICGTLQPFTFWALPTQLLFGIAASVSLRCSKCHRSSRSRGRNSSQLKQHCRRSSIRQLTRGQSRYAQTKAKRPLSSNYREKEQLLKKDDRRKPDAFPLEKFCE